MRNACAVIAMFLATFMVAPHADAHPGPHRNCVTKQQLNGIQYQTRNQLEKRWGVEGSEDFMGLLDGVAFKKCGFPITDRYYLIVWDANARGPYLIPYVIIYDPTQVVG